MVKFVQCHTFSKRFERSISIKMRNTVNKLICMHENVNSHGHRGCVGVSNTLDFYRPKHFIQH